MDLHSDVLALQRLKDAAEKAKDRVVPLPSAPRLICPTSPPTSPARSTWFLQLTRAKLEALTTSLLEQTVVPCRTALKDAKVDQVDEVILVGGNDAHAGGARNS